MIIVFKFANFTCCCGRCCDGGNIFGHTSLFCSNLGFGLSAGHREPHFADWGAFLKYQGRKFGRIEDYVCIPTREDGAPRGEGGEGEEGRRLLGNIRMSEGDLSTWWEGLKRNAGARDCSDLVTDALKEAGARETSCWARRLSSLFVVTPNSCVAYGEALALDMCNTGRIGGDAYRALVRGLGPLPGVNKFNGPGGGCWPF
jgi:hypothetical protein